MGNRTLDVEDEDVEAYVLDLASKLEMVEKKEIDKKDAPTVEDIATWYKENSSHVPFGYFFGMFIGIVITLGIALAVTPIFIIRVAIEGLINRLRGA